MSVSGDPAQNPRVGNPMAGNPMAGSSVFIAFMAGGVSAAISTTAGAPIERIKLLLQNQGEMVKQGRLDRPYSGIGNTVARIYKTEGLISFWRGNTASVVRYFPAQAINFAFKDYFRALFKIRQQDPFWTKLRTSVAAGGVASATSLLFVYSLDYARTRLATDVVSAAAKGGERQFNGLIDVYKKTLASDGVVGLYRGFVPSVTAIAVYRGLYFGMYDTLSPLVAAGPFLNQFLLAWAVTTGAGTVSYPLDTIRRRMMMTSCSENHYRGMLDAGKQIVAKEGTISLFRGYGVQLLKGVAGASLLVGYDLLERHLSLKA